MAKTRRPSTVAAQRQARREERELLRVRDSLSPTLTKRKGRARSAPKGATADSFQNFSLNLGMGTGNALSGSSYGFNPITRVRTLLEWMFRGTWIGGVAVNCRAQDMTRAGIQINTDMDPVSVDKIQRALTKKGVWRGMRDTKRWANLYGGAVAVILVEGQDLSTPLRVDSVGPGQFKGLAVLDRWMVDPTITAGGLVEELGPNLGKPKYYAVRSDSSMLPMTKIHYSRVLRLLGDDMPYWQAVMENLWGTSVYERIYDRIVAFDSATAGAAQSIYKSYIRTYKIAKLRELVTTGGPAYQGLLRYVQMMQTFQGIEGVTLIDGTDEFVGNQSNVQSGIAEGLVQFGQQLCGALQIPAVRLFGMSPAGMNSTGESDWRNYYDGVLEDQETDFREFLDVLLPVVARSEGVALPDDFGFSFTPLWQMTAIQKADVADKKTDTIIKAKEAGLYGVGTALKELRQQSKETGVHTNISDEDVKAAEEADRMQPPGAESVLGGTPGQPGEPGAELGGGGAPAAAARDPEGRRGHEPVELPKPHPASKRGESGESSSLRDLETGSALSAIAGAVTQPALSGIAEQVSRAGSESALARIGEVVARRSKKPSALEGIAGSVKKLSAGAAETVEPTTALGQIAKVVASGRSATPGEDPGEAPALASIAREVRMQRRRSVMNGDEESALPLHAIGNVVAVLECQKGDSRFGKPWPAGYGYIYGFGSAEGEHEQMDCFFGDGDLNDCDPVVINHFRKDGSFEEHKVMFGYPTEEAAKKDYAEAYGDWLPQAHAAQSVPMTHRALQEWLELGEFDKPLPRPSPRLASGGVLS